MNDAQRAQWYSILGLSRALFLDPALKPFQDNVEPDFSSTKTSRIKEHRARGCHENEVSIVTKSPNGGSFKKYFTKDHSRLSPQPYERLTQEVLHSDHGSISMDLKYRPIRYGGIDEKTGHEIIVLDNETNYYDTRVVKLVSVEEPTVPPQRTPNESDEEFLKGKEFRVIESFRYSEDIEEDIEHDIAWTGQTVGPSVEEHIENYGAWNAPVEGLSVDIMLQRLRQHLGYITSLRPAIADKQSISPTI
jgi:hypothetical protein